MILELLIIILLVLIILFLVWKLHLFHLSLKEIEEELAFILKKDTNQLIIVSSNNKQIKRIANTFNQYLKELRLEIQKNKKGNIELNMAMTNLTHDLRTPLTAINGYTNMLKENITSEKEKKYLEIIERKCRELTDLTEELFSLSKAIDQKEQMKREKVCLNAILEEVISSYYALIKERNIDITIHLCTEKIIRYLDKSSVIRILENLIFNCIKYSKSNLNISLTKKGIITFSNETMLDFLSTEKLFHRYFTVESAKKANGLGLSIVKELVKLNGGVIKAKYQSGKLEIKINFPLKRIENE